MTWLNSVSTKAIIYSPLLKCKHWSFELFELERWRMMKILSGREKKKRTHGHQNFSPLHHSIFNHHYSGFLSRGGQFYPIRFFWFTSKNGIWQAEISDQRHLFSTCKQTKGGKNRKERRNWSILSNESCIMYKSMLVIYTTATIEVLPYHWGLVSS